MRITRITVSSLARRCVGLLHTHVDTCVVPRRPAGRPAGGKTEQGLFLSSSVTRRFKSLHGSTREAEEERSTKQERRLRFRAQTWHNAVASAPFLESPCTWSSPLPCCDYYKKRICTYEKVEYIVGYERRESARDALNAECLFKHGSR